MSFRPSYAEISRKALETNLKLLLEMTENPFFCPMVKANAYGHGAIEVVQYLRHMGIKYFGVSLYEEALELREAGIDDVEILVFSPLLPTAIESIKKHQLTPVLCSYQDFECLKDHSLQGQKVHIKFNVGMARLGFSTEEAKIIQQKILDMRLILEGVCSHLPSATDLSSEVSSTQTQIQNFINLKQVFGDDVFYHAFNSDALMMHAQLDPSYKKLIGSRPGIALYGYPNIATNLNFQPVMSVKTQLVHILDVKKGQGVSYGPSWIAQRDTRVGVLPLGYADGIHRRLSNKHGAYVGDSFCPLIGTVCMDYCMLDLTDLSLSNDELYKVPVCIIGGSERVAVDKIAESLDTISYEILTGISERVPRVYA